MAFGNGRAGARWRSGIAHGGRKEIVFGRWRGAGHRPAPHGAHAISAPYHSSIHDIPQRGRKFPRYYRPAVSQIARENYDGLAQTSRRSSARGIGPTQADN